MYVDSEGASRLSPAEVVRLALNGGCDLIHVGWSALNRSPELAARVEDVGLTLVGPSHTLLGLVGNRAQMREAAARCGVAVVPGSDPIGDETEAEQWLASFGYPVIARSSDEYSMTLPVPLVDAQDARTQLPRLLSHGPVSLERRVIGAREVEVVVIGDGQGEALTLGERDTSVQLGAQRMLIENPAVDLVEDLAMNLRRGAATLASGLCWPGLLAVRFLVTPDDRGYLLRLRPGMQAWHGVTELSLGVDLVDAELRIAMGDRLGWQPHHLDENGHSICIRLFSIDKSTKKIDQLKLPEGVRVESGFESGDLVAPQEEICQIIAHAPTRQAAIVRAKAAIDGTSITGLDTNLNGMCRLFDRQDFWVGPVDRDTIAGLLT